VWKDENSMNSLFLKSKKLGENVLENLFLSLSLSLLAKKKDVQMIDIFFSFANCVKNKVFPQRKKD
jgi:hypothetical protein